MTVRKLDKSEIPEAMALVWEVFSQFEAPEYSAEGASNFKNVIHSDEFRNMIVLYGAFEGDALLGVAATRDGGSHVALFFVRAEYHRRGIGRRLFEAILKDSTSNTLTVHSSPYAVEVYKRLGFTPNSEEVTMDGIRFVPMTYKKAV